MKTCPRCHLRYPEDATKCFVDGEDLVPMKDPRVGLVLAGRYEIESVVAEGGMATVYLARHRVVNRECAVKILSSALVRNKVVRERFRREAKATQKLAHPNIIEILDHGETDDGMPYLVMEYLQGETLAEAIEKGPMGLDVALPIGIQIARALARAHDFDVIHRDLKPENVFLCDRDSAPPLAKLLDFGIARSMQDARLTSAGEVFGTPQYMAPERITSIDAGPSADLYSFGVMLFEMLAGRLPFNADDVGTFFARHMNETPPTLKEIGVDVPARLDQLIASLMAKVAEKRPVDAHAISKELVDLCNETDVQVPPELQAQAPVEQQPPKTLPPASIDRWARRTLIFEQMLAKAHGSTPPPEARDLLTTIQRHVREISVLRADAVKAQRKLTALEAKSKEGRQRFGNAVEGLGVDASKAREEARAAHDLAKERVKKTTELGKKAQELHRDIILWEGRSAFQEPYPQLAEAYRAAANAIDLWHQAREQDKAAQQRASELDGIVNDLEYQIEELRTGLLRLEKSSEQEREAIENQSVELGQRAEALEHEIMALATKLCDPMRDDPALAGLFRQLEGGTG